MPRKYEIYREVFIMKTVYLIRHSTPDKTSGLANERIPLSGEGRERAKALAAKIHADLVVSSELQRAKETAGYLSADFQTDGRFNERRLGGESTLDADFWVKQYADIRYKNDGGESLLEVGERMEDGILAYLGAVGEGQSAAIVSHAAAICAYLLRHCSIEVLDARRKIRKITFREKVLLEGKFETPDGFKLAFENDRLLDVRRIQE